MRKRNTLACRVGSAERHPFSRVTTRRSSARVKGPACRAPLPEDRPWSRAPEPERGAEPLAGAPCPTPFEALCEPPEVLADDAGAPVWWLRLPPSCDPTAGEDPPSAERDPPADGATLLGVDGVGTDGTCTGGAGTFVGTLGVEMLGTGGGVTEGVETVGVGTGRRGTVGVDTVGVGTVGVDTVGRLGVDTVGILSASEASLADPPSA